MKDKLLSKILIATITMSGFVMTGQVLAAQEDQNVLTAQDQDQLLTQDQDQVYGSQFMTPQERAEMRAAKNDQERKNSVWNNINA